VVRVDDDKFGVARTFVGEAENFISDLELIDPGADFFDHAGDIGSLTGRKSRRPEPVHEPSSDGGFTRIDACSLHAHQDLSRPGFGSIHFNHAQDIDVAVLVKSHCS